MLVEQVYREWAEESPERTLVIVRPTVVFGKNNRGNVYNLLKQMASGRFFMVGKCTNKKSMAYVENVAAFLKYSLNFGPGTHIYNYIDKPDFDMNTLVELVNITLGREKKAVKRIPYVLGYVGGKMFDLASLITGKKFPISGIRVKKFCSTTQFSKSIFIKLIFLPPAT